MLGSLATAGLLAHSTLSLSPPDPLAEFIEWADAKGYDLLSPVCSPERVCYSAIPPGDVVLVWVGGEEGTLYVPEDGSQLGASDDTFQVLTELDVNLYFLGEGARICDDYLTAEEFGAATGVGADAMGEIVFGFLIWEFETNWSERWGGEHRATDLAREAFRQRLDECTGFVPVVSPGPNETLLRAVETAQRVATATADEDWATYRELRPEPEYTDAELEEGYAGLESATIVLASWSPADGDALDLYLGLIAHESRSAGPRTALHCVVWRYFPDSDMILGLSGTAEVYVETGFVNPADLVARAQTACADEEAPTVPTAAPVPTVPFPTAAPPPPPPPATTPTPPQFVTIPMDGMHIEMSGRYATVFDDCANVECTISGAATEMGAVLPGGWWFTAGYFGDDGVLYVTATDGTDTQTWGITSLFDPQQWQLGGA